MVGLKVSEMFVPLLRSEEHTSELQSHDNLVCRLLLEKKKRLTAAAAAPVPNPPRRAHALPPARGVEVAAGRRRVGMGGQRGSRVVDVVFFFNDTATTEIYTLSLHDALPI